MRISELQQKDVVNTVDGKKLGHVVDVEFDMVQGRIEALLIPNAVRFFGWLGGGTELVISWKQIVKIGADVILIRLDPTHILADEVETVHVETIKPFRKV